MPELAVAGMILAIFVVASALYWGWSRRVAAVARRRSERIERKLDALLHYLGLEDELEEIGVEPEGSGQPPASANSLSTEPPMAARVRSTRSRT